MPTVKKPANKRSTRHADGETAGFEPGLRDSDVEAILLAADRAVTAGRIAEAMGVTADDGGAGVIRDAIDRLNASYEGTGRSFRIEEVAGGYRAVTMAEHAEAIASFQAGRAQRRLSRAALETLSIIAYRQPVTRAEVEAIRGVACGEVLRSLLDRRLIAITGRAEEVGRPMLYGTTKRFLETFGVASVRDLPAPEGFKRKSSASPGDSASSGMMEDQAEESGTEPASNGEGAAHTGPSDP